MSIPTQLPSQPDTLTPNRLVAKSWPSLSLRVSERKLMLAFGDLVALNLALLGTVLLSSSSFSLSLSALWDQLYWFIIISTFWLAVGLVLGVYDLRVASRRLHSVWLAGGTAFLVAGAYMLIPYLSPALPSRRLYLFMFPVLSAAGVSGWRALYATALVQPIFEHRALVVGAGRSGQALARAVASNNRDAEGRDCNLGYRLIGFIDDADELQGSFVECVPVLGNGRDLVRVAEVLRPDELVIATNPEKINDDLFRAILDCREYGVPVTTMANVYERVTGRIPVEFAGRSLYVVLPLQHPASYRLYMAGRRLFDIVAAILGCSLVVLVAPLVYWANRLTSPGDLFYWQERIGEGGKSFNLLKFRSMRMNAEEDTGAVWALENDPRITPVGRFLRRTRLDEVPQFWNVLKGEMSLIGPRPERPWFVNQLAQEIPFYRVRHAVKPGISGWAQVNYRYGASAEDAQIKLEYDLYYIKHQSPYLDLQILLKTIQVMFSLRGR